MSWQGIEGHDEIVDQFRQSISSHRLGSTFLFVGPEGIGKRTFATKLAASFFCEQVLSGQNAPLDPCGGCAACTQVQAGTHPDMDVIVKPDDSATIPLDALIGDKNHRMREGLCARIAMKASRGGRKVAIIDDADFLNQEGANCLLKTLEEPPPGSVLILIGTSPERQLPTIRSRCTIVRFRPLEDEVLTRLLRTAGTISDPKQLALIASMAGGSLAEAAKWNDASLWDFRATLFASLSESDWDAFQLAKSTSEFVDAAGKEAPKRRQRLRMVIEMVSGFYRQLMRQSVGMPPSGDRSLDGAIATRRQNGPLDAEVIAACIDRNDLARQHVDANANQSTNIEAWLDDLAQIIVHQATTTGW